MSWGASRNPTKDEITARPNKLFGARFISYPTLGAELPNFLSLYCKIALLLVFEEMEKKVKRM